MPLGVAALSVVALILRAWPAALGAPLWYDEQFSRLLAQQSVPVLIAGTAGDVHPPLWYLILHITGMVLGWSPAAMRLPSVLAGVLAVPLMWHLARLAGAPVAARYMAVVLVAILPGQIYYGHEARMYAVLQLALMVAMVGALSRRAGLVAGGLLVSIYLHNFGLLYAAATLLWWLWREAGDYDELSRWQALRSRWWWWERGATPIFTGAVLLLAYAPWAAYALLGQLAEQHVGWWKTGTTLGGLAYNLYMLWWVETWDGTLAALATALTVTASTVAVLWAVRARQWGLLWLCVAVPGMALLAEVVYRPVLLHRALIGIMPPLLLAVAWAWAESRHRAANSVALLALVILGGLAAPGATVAGKSATIGNVVERIMLEYQPGDVILHGTIGTWMDGREWPAEWPQYLLEQATDQHGVPNAQVRAALGVAQWPAGGPPHTGRIWLVWGAAPTISAAQDARHAAMLMSGLPRANRGTWSVAGLVDARLDVLWVR